MANDGNYRLISLSDGSSSDKVVFGYSSSGVFLVEIISLGILQFSTEVYSNDITQNNKVAFKYKQNDVALWLNGVKVFTNTSANMPVGLSELNFNYTNALPFYGKTKALAVWKEALSDEELTELTTI